MLPFAIVDVFTLSSPDRPGASAAPRPYTGNQLAVVYEAEALSTEQMQAIAVEFGFSETAFVLPPTTGEADYRARIFTPTEELPFAGHPTIGSAVAAVGSGRVEATGGTVVQECAAGLMRLELDGARAKLTSEAISAGGDLDAATAAAACGLEASRVIGTPQAASAGYSHNFVRLADADVASAVHTPGHLKKVYLFSFDAATNAVHARLFHAGVGEDPATGSAALALGVHLVEQGLVGGDGAHTYAIAQGAEMGRPSTMLGEVAVEGGKAVSVSVAGEVAVVAQGELVTLPSAR